jgi:hypothetical protein
MLQLRALADELLGLIRELIAELRALRAELAGRETTTTGGRNHDG